MIVIHNPFRKRKENAMKKTYLMLAAIVAFLFLLTPNAHSQPQAPVLSFFTSGSWVSLSWTKVPGATGYTLSAAAIPFTGVESVGTMDMGTQTEATFNLWQGAAFYVAVQARDATGFSPYSNLREVVIGNLSPLLDSKVIPKYQDALIIPPVMPTALLKTDLPQDEQAVTPWDSRYEIAVKQFDQQIMPSSFPKTTVWSYGDLLGPAPGQPGTTFNYPAFTVEARSDEVTRVTWTNGLVDDSGKYLPHLLSVDRTLHWANPELLKCMDGTFHTDCRPDTTASFQL